MAFHTMLLLFPVVCLLTPLTESWCCCPSDSGLCQTSALSLMDLSWSVTTKDLLLQLRFLAFPCLHMYIFWMEKKLELIFKSQVPRAHIFWMEKQGHLIWSGPKSPGTPFHLVVLLQNCSCYSLSILVQCTETDGDQDIPCVIAQLLAGGGWRKKQLYFMFYFPLCIRFIIL